LNSLRENILHVLSELQPSLKLLKDDCFLIGASALLLSGIEIEHTSDIDLLTSANDALLLRKAWNSHWKDYQPEEKKRFRSDFARYNLGVLDVEVMGALEVESEGEWFPIHVRDYVTFREEAIEIKIPTLKEQASILKLFGREKDIKKLALIANIV
jgi:hypothetical protein